MSVKKNFINLSLATAAVGTILVPVSAIASPNTPSPTTTSTPVAAVKASPNSVSVSTGTIKLNAIKCTGSCAANGAFYSGYGKSTISGTVSPDIKPGDKLNIYMKEGNNDYVLLGTAPVSTDRTFSFANNINHVTTLTYRVTTADGKIASISNTVQTSNPAVIMSSSNFSGDTMIGTKFSGRLNVGLAGQKVSLRTWLYFPSEKRSRWSPWRTVTTTTGGAFSGTFTYKNGVVGKQSWSAEANYSNDRTKSYSSPAFTVNKVPYLDQKVSSVTPSMVPRTWHSGCPVGPSHLSKISMNYYGFDGKIHAGYIIVNKNNVDQFKAPFAAAFNAKFPFRVMQDPSPYGNDENSMTADNTYAFYCRQVTGNPYVLSPHSYGRSVDINTVENPYQIPDGTWLPANGRSYVNRSNVRPGMLFSSSPMTKSFLNNGFKWLVGFDWQHFQIR